MSNLSERERRISELRAQRREFVRTQHPDVGGDPVAFAAGLGRFDTRIAALGHDVPQPVQVFAQRRAHGGIRFVAAVRTFFGRGRRPPRVR